jgi:hypothetical protein
MTEAKVTSVLTGAEVPEALAGVQGLSRGHEFAPFQRSKLAVTGLPASGKSTLINSNPQCIVVDLEEGGKTVPDPQALRFNPQDSGGQKSWVEVAKGVDDFVNTICMAKRKGLPEYNHVAFDSFDALVELFSKELMEQSKIRDVGDYGGGHGKGYAIVRTKIFAILDQLWKAGFGWSVIAHISVEPGGDNGPRRLDLAVSPSFRTHLYRVCEHMLFLDHAEVTRYRPDKKIPGTNKVIKDETGYQERAIVMKTRTGSLWRGGHADAVKVRVPFPDVLEIPRVGGWNVVEEAYEKATESMVGE